MVPNRRIGRRSDRRCCAAGSACRGCGPVEIGEGVVKMVEMSLVQLTWGRIVDEERGAAKAGNTRVVLGAAEPSSPVVSVGVLCS